MRSHALRGQRAVTRQFEVVKASINTAFDSGVITARQRFRELARVARIYLGRIGVSAKGMTDEIATDLADMVASVAENWNEIVASIRGEARRSAKKGELPRLVPVPGAGAPRGRASGGVIPGYGGGDVVPALLEAGEGILRKEVVRAIGPARIDALNRDPSSLVRLNYGGDGMMAHAVSFSPRGGGALSGGNVNHINITTAPKPDLPPDPAVVAAQLTMHMRARGLG
jgi:hypothetical protein